MSRPIVAAASKSTCSTNQSKEPYLVNWPSADRARLEAQLRRGLALVRYSGCTLDIVDDCAAVPTSSYSYIALTPKEDEVRIQTVDDLYTHLPLGAASLEGELRSSGELRVASKIAGRYEYPANSVSLSMLEGSGCTRATHAVRAITVGAFQLFSASSTKTTGGIAAFGAKAGGSTQEGAEALSRDGNFEACTVATDAEGPSPNCGGLLRIELLRVNQVEQASLVKRERVCPPGQRFVPFAGCQAAAVADGEADAGAEGDASSDRFVQEGGTVFDTTTGLTWQAYAPTNRMTWMSAKRYCLGIAVDGKVDWRLPKKPELETLIDKKQEGPKIDTRVFPMAAGAAYWTLSTDRSNPGDSWAVDFHRGVPESRGQGSMFYVRCVR